MTREIPSDSNGADGADALLWGSASNVPSGGGNDARWRLGRLRSVAAVAACKLTPFHGARNLVAKNGEKCPPGVFDDV